MSPTASDRDTNIFFGYVTLAEFFSNYPEYINSAQLLHYPCFSILLPLWNNTVHYQNNYNMLHFCEGYFALYNLEK